MSGLFGGSSSSSQSTSQADNRTTIGNGAINAQGGSSVQVLDGGAIQNAFDFAGDVSTGGFDLTKTTLTKALEYARASQGQALDSLNTTTSLIKDSYANAKGRGAMTDYILLGSIAVAGLVAFTAVKK